MFKMHHLWKTGRRAPQVPLAHQVPAASQRPRRRRWIYGIGVLLPLLIVTPALATTVTEWSGWFQVPAPAPLPTASTPAAVLYDTGKTAPGCSFLCVDILTQYVFVRQSNGTLEYSTSDRKTASSALTPVPGGGGTPSAPTAAQLGNTLYLFVQGTDNVVWVNKFNGTTWSNWSQLHVGSTSSLVPTASGPFVVRYQNALYLLVRESDGTIHFTRTSNGASWDPLTAVPGGGGTPSTPTAAVFGTTLYAFAQGTDNVVWVNKFNGTSWTGWSRPLSNGATPISTSTSPVAGSDGNNGFHLIVRTSSGAIVESVTFDGTTWGGVSEITAGGLTPSAPTTLALPDVFSGLFVFAQGTDNIVWENDFEVIPG